MDNRKWKAGGLAAVVLGCGAWLHSYFASRPAAGEPIAFLRPATCTACGASYAARFGAQPAGCERCGRPTLWHAVKCANTACAAILPATTTDGRAPRCPKCGGTAVTEPASDDLR